MSALQAGHTVAFCPLRPSVDPAKLKPLLDAGLGSIPQARGSKFAALLKEKLSWKVGTAVRRLFPIFQGIRDFAPDVIFHNAGDPLPKVELVNDLESLGLLRIPYFVACHNSYLFGAPPARSEREIFARYYTQAKRVFFVANRTRRETEHLLATRLEQAVIVRNPVNMQDLGAIPMPPGDTLRFAAMGRLVTRSKGQDLLLAALGSERLRQANWTLSIFGTGPNLEHLKLLAQHYGIAEKVTFRGHVNDVRAVWAQHHMLLLPSRHESAPLVIVEAMLCGRPCVATDVGGVAEWISEPETGFLSPGIDIESFEAALYRALCAQADVTAIGLRAQQKARAMVDPNPGGTLLRLVVEKVSSH